MAILGTVFGIFWGLIAMVVGAADNELNGDSSIVWLGISAIAACCVAMTASGFHFSGKRTGWATVALFVATIWHVVSISAFGIPGFIFLLLAAIFAATSMGRPTPTTAATSAAEAS